MTFWVILAPSGIRDGLWAANFILVSVGRANATELAPPFSLCAPPVLRVATWLCAGAAAAAPEVLWCELFQGC